MRYPVFVVLALLAGCTVAPDRAPIMFKDRAASPGPLVDGVPLSVLCELADKVGTEYLASDVKQDEALEIEQRRLNFNLLEIEGVSCGRPDDILDLPFVSDPQRTLVSTWGEFQSRDNGDVWGSCVADTSRPIGDHVVYCEISELSEGQILTPVEDEPITQAPAGLPETTDSDEIILIEPMPETDPGKDVRLPVPELNEPASNPEPSE